MESFDERFNKRSLLLHLPVLFSDTEDVVHFVHFLSFAKVAKPPIRENVSIRKPNFINFFMTKILR
jgi:hypothetical protein